jgi:hypothetical protein
MPRGSQAATRFVTWKPQDFAQVPLEMKTRGLCSARAGERARGLRALPPDAHHATSFCTGRTATARLRPRRRPLRHRSSDRVGRHRWQSDCEVSSRDVVVAVPTEPVRPVPVPEAGRGIERDGGTGMEPAEPAGPAGDRDGAAGGTEVERDLADGDGPVTYVDDEVAVERGRARCAGIRTRPRSTRPPGSPPSAPPPRGSWQLPHRSCPAVGGPSG